MKTLILVRHANALSAWEARVQKDALRPLSQEGLNTARQTAQRIADLGYAPQIILASPLVRAQQTAEILASVRHAPLSTETVLNGMHTEEDVLDLLSQYLQTQDCILAVGHNPNISVLAQKLTHAFRPFHPGAFIVLNMDNAQEPQVLHFGE